MRTTRYERIATSNSSDPTAEGAIYHVVHSRRALRENGIEITSLHNHLLNDETRLFFMHFWGNEDAVKLARGLRAALDKTNSRRAAH